MVGPNPVWLVSLEETQRHAEGHVKTKAEKRSCYQPPDAKDGRQQPGARRKVWSRLLGAPQEPGLPTWILGFGPPELQENAHVVLFCYSSSRKEH